MTRRVNTLILAFLICLTFSLPAASAGREEQAAKNAASRLEKKFKKTKSALGDPVFFRIFKAEAALEVWLKPKNQKKYELFHTYRICYFSGELGPKTKSGDNQAPEGFYAVSLKRLNPFSSYHLSFDLGYPNAYEKAQGYTGSLLMVHGDCRSAGCYAMGNNNIEEIYTIAKAALDNGQSFFRVHAFPFRLSKQNLEKYKNNKWIDFWKSLKPIYDKFEKTQIPPEVNINKDAYKLAGQ